MRDVLYWFSVTLLTLTQRKTNMSENKDTPRGPTLEGLGDFVNGRLPEDNLKPADKADTIRSFGEGRTPAWRKNIEERRETGITRLRGGNIDPDNNPGNVR
jgi:hypothetical protein